MPPIPIDASIIVVLIVVGIVVALPSSMCGLGGGILFIPILLIFFQFSPQNAIAISLLAMCGNTVSCSISYACQRRINYKLALVYDVLDPLGVWVGAWLTTVLLANVLIGIVATIVFLMGYFLIRKTRKDQMDNHGSFDGTCVVEPNLPSPAPSDAVENPLKQLKKKDIPGALASSFGSGFVSGLAGLGGGVTDTTTMILMGVPPHVAGPTSEFAMAFTNIIAVVTHALLGNMIWEAGIPLMVGAILGAQIGARMSKRVKSHILIYLLVTFAWFAAIRLFITVFTGI